MIINYRQCSVSLHDVNFIEGDDMRYTFVNGTDYTSENFTSGVQYQLQAIHTTKVYHYNDTLDMLVISKAKDMPMTTLRVCEKLELL